MLKKALFDIIATLAELVYSLGETKIMQKIYERYENVFEKYEDKYPTEFFFAYIVVYTIAYLPFMTVYYIVKDKIEKK